MAPMQLQALRSQGAKCTLHPHFQDPFHDTSNIFWDPGREVLYHKHKDARYTPRVIQYSKQYAVRRAAEKFKVSAGSIDWRHSREKREEERRKRFREAFIHCPGAVGGDGGCIGLCLC